MTPTPETPLGLRGLPSSFRVITNRQHRKGGPRLPESPYKDGSRILLTIVTLIKEERPLQFFTLSAVLVFLSAIILGFPLLLEYRKTHLVPRLPTAILSAALVMISFLCQACGLIMDSLSRARKEIKRLAYLSIGKPFP